MNTLGQHPILEGFSRLLDLHGDRLAFRRVAVTNPAADVENLRADAQVAVEKVLSNRDDARNGSERDSRRTSVAAE